MKLSLITALVFFASSALASAETLLKKVTCQTSDLKVVIEATHEEGGEYALLAWTVYKEDKLIDYFMSYLNYEDRSLQSFGGSTLGSHVWVKGNTAELSLKDDEYLLSCQ